LQINKRLVTAHFYGGVTRFVLETEKFISGLLNKHFPWYQCKYYMDV